MYCAIWKSADRPGTTALQTPTRMRALETNYTFG